MDGFPSIGRSLFAPSGPLPRCYVSGDARRQLLEILVNSHANISAPFNSVHLRDCLSRIQPVMLFKRDKVRYLGVRILGPSV